MDFTFRSGVFSRKSRKLTFRARKAIRETANRLFWKADPLTCLQGNKTQMTVKFDERNPLLWGSELRLV